MAFNRMKTRIELRISCANLISRDVFSASDPMVVVKQKNVNGKYVEVGRTEMRKNTNSPDFAETIDIEYFFEEVQHLKVAVYDKDSDSDSTDDDDGLGKITTTLGQIVSKKEITEKLSKQNSSSHAPCTITIKSSEVTDTNELSLTLEGKGLDKKDFMGKSDPFLNIYRREADSTWTLVHTTEVKSNTLKPKWEPFCVRIQNLCYGDLNQPIWIGCYDHDNSGDNDLIGECTTTVHQLLSKETSPIPLINPKKKAKKKDYKNSGKLFVLNSQIERRYSFLDYIYGGMQINFTCGIDFTGSNGDPNHRDSLHYIGSVNPNEYVQALDAVGRVIQDYDSDKLYPAFGFGAKIPPTNEVSHEFALNFMPQNPYCAGIEGIVNAYHNAVRTVKLWGPTNISPIINHVANFAHQAQQSPIASQYFVLLLVTDGVVTDIAETLQAIVRASQLPMSIIIVGVGNADFTAMEFLDGDKGELGVQRDIVQFVPFRKYKMAATSTLASHVLQEIPNQVVSYFKNRNLAPGIIPT